MLLEELKLYKTEKFKIIGFFLVNLILFFSVNYSIDYIKNNEGAQIMSLGIINNDSQEEVQYFLNILNNTDIGKSFEIIEVDENNAKKMVLQNKISAYITIPEGFIRSIHVGENLPLSIVVNEGDWLKNTIIQLAMNIASSYLTTAQAGIYSTIDTAYELGADSKNVDEFLMPINISYGLSLLGYQNYFDKKIVSSTGNIDVMEYYTFSAIFFLMMISITMIINNVQEITKNQILNKYRMCGMKLEQVLLNKFLALTIVIFLYTFPILYFFKLKGILVVLLTVSITFFIAVISDSAFGIINVLFICFFSLFISGGIIPLIFLPNTFKILARLTPNYWVININSSFFSSIYIVIYILILNMITYYIINRRLAK